LAGAFYRPRDATGIALSGRVNSNPGCLDSHETLNQ
jgi:hypothetical protein